MTVDSLHRVRGRVEVALDVIGRAVIAHRPDGSEEADRVLEGLCAAARELAEVAGVIDGQVRAQVAAGPRSYASNR